MIVIYLLIPLSILIAVGFLAAFIWAVRSGQYEDTHTPSLRMLWEDRGPHQKTPPATTLTRPTPQLPDKE
jgi:cbb3-type cytochrome oxidase maturation protein